MSKTAGPQKHYNTCTPTPKIEETNPILCNPRPRGRFVCEDAFAPARMSTSRRQSSSPAAALFST